MSQLLISAAHKSSGKTTITLGLCAALSNRAIVVQAFKKGPDYIDPMWLSLASGRPCHNLDFYTSNKQELLSTVSRYTADADLALIEGNKGLHDGMDIVVGSNSNAALAKLLGSPVVMVLDVRGTIRGVAPLLIGYQAFDPEVHIAGVILNQVGGQRHETKLRTVIEHYTDIPILGAIRRDTRLELVERHLGLMPSNEDQAANVKIAGIAQAIAAQVDLERLLEIARSASLPATTTPTPSFDSPLSAKEIRLGIARDASFGFYYQGDLEALEQAGAQLISIDTLRDERLPEIDGLFIGGGFPETHMAELERNRSLRYNIRRAIEDGLPVYAECGGMMYLTRSLSWKGRRCEMVGAIKADTVMYDRPQGRGYIRLQETGLNLWPKIAGQDLPEEIAGHEFHYSGLHKLQSDMRYAYRMLRGSGIDGKHDGIVYKNLLASYSHLRDTSRYHWTKRFVQFIRNRKVHAKLSA